MTIRVFIKFASATLLLAVAVFGSLLSTAQQATPSQSSSSMPSDPEVVRAEISRIIAQSIKDATLKLPDGQTVTTRPLPSREDIDKVKHFGNQATTVLHGYLTSSNSVMEQQVALRLLDAVGTEQALDVIATFAEKAESPFIRSQALFVIASSTREKDALLLKKISTDDPDPRVRNQALDLIRRKSSK